MSEKKTRAIIFILVTFFTWLFYFMTTAPTVVFWDVGEFLACSHILGIPHPPGTPLYVILGRFMDLMPIPLASLFKLINGNEAVNHVLKVTSVSMLSGAFTAGFAYLVVVKIVEKWDAPVPKSFAHIAGIFAAFIGAFARTVWMNSIEAETYTPSVFIMVFLTWVALNWWEHRDSEKSIKYILFSLYVLFLSSGIHLMPLIFFPALFVFVWVVKPKLIWDMEFLVVAAATFALIALMKLTYEPGTGSVALMIVSLLVMAWYLYYRKLFDINDFQIMLFIAGFVVVLVGLYTKNSILLIIGTFLDIIILYIKARLYKDWKGFALILIVVAFSAEFTMMVRAIHNPKINETDPSNWKAFMDALLRKQYEPAKILPRRIPFTDQLLLFWRYFTWQYASLVLPLTFLGLLGLVTHFGNDKKTFALVGTALFMGSLALIIYLNLKDSPTHPINPINPREVRDRDYFFAPFYTYFAIFMGLGLWEIMRLFAVYLKKWVVGLVVGILLAGGLQAVQFKHFWPLVDRTHNYMAEDYAYDLLISPRKNPNGGPVILYTNGDNDTFPVWFDQDVLGYRTDVIIANLSLINTNWYVKQLKDWGAPISFTKAEIDKLPPALLMPGGKVLYLRDIMIRDMIATSAGYKFKPDDYVQLTPGLRVPKLYFAPADTFLNKVIKGAKFKIPIYFALTVTPDVYKPWSKYLLSEGLAFRLMSHNVSSGIFPEGINTERTKYLLHGNMSAAEFLKKYADAKSPWGIFRYRGIFDNTYKDGTHLKLVRNLASVALRLGYYYSFQDSIDAAIDELYFSKKLAEVVVKYQPQAMDVQRQLIAIDLMIGNLYKQKKDYANAIKYYEDAMKIQKVPLLYKQIGLTYLEEGDTAKAVENLEIALSMTPKDRDIYDALKSIYKAKKDTVQLKRLMEDWIKNNPSDSAEMKELKKLGGK